MPLTKPAPSSSGSSAEENAFDLGLPEDGFEEFDEQDSKPPFAVQIAHAQMLLAFQKNGDNHPPRQTEEFVI
jgi:hypothetical protein